MCVVCQAMTSLAILMLHCCRDLLLLQLAKHKMHNLQIFINHEDD